MMMPLSRRAVALPALAIIAALSAFACSGGPDDTATPTATDTATANSTATAVTTATDTPVASIGDATPLPTPAATATVPPTATATVAPTRTPRPTPEPGEVSVTDDWSIDFPQSISFSLDVTSDKPVKNAELRFNYPLAHSCTQGFYNSVRIEPDDPNNFETSWDFEMEKQGSLPPGTKLTYHWVITDEDGAVYETDDKDILWEDSRFQWSAYTSGNITIHWYDGTDSFGPSLLTSVEDRLDRMELGVTLDKPIQAYIYPDAATLRQAVLYTQAWTGGLAFSNQNILLIAIGPTAPPAQVDGLVHELTHLLVGEVSFSCIGDRPTWLDEGLATYSEGDVTAAEQADLDKAMADGKLITLQSLSASFPADDSGATLAYTQSKSIVTYLIEEFGWDKMNELLDTFQQGSTYEAALVKVYNKDLQALDTAWRAWLATQ